MKFSTLLLFSCLALLCFTAQGAESSVITPLLVKPTNGTTVTKKSKISTFLRSIIFSFKVEHLRLQKIKKLSLIKKQLALKTKFSKKCISFAGKYGVVINGTQGKFHFKFNKTGSLFKSGFSKKEKAYLKSRKFLTSKLFVKFGKKNSQFETGFGGFLGGSNGHKFAKKLILIKTGKLQHIGMKKVLAKVGQKWNKKLFKSLGLVKKDIKKIRKDCKESKKTFLKLKKIVQKIGNTHIKIQTKCKLVISKKPKTLVKIVKKPVVKKPIVKKPVVKKVKQCKCVKVHNGNKKVCCEVKKVCKKGVCKNVEFNCKTKKVYVDHRTYVCAWKKRNEKTKQQHCCLHVKSCCGKKCSLKTRNCSWRGSKLFTEYKKGCIWKVVGATEKQKVCCSTKKVCQDKKCQQIRFNCKSKGELIKQTVEEKCEWKSIGKESTQRSCCQFKVHCVGSRCNRKKLHCKLTSDVIKRSQKKRCEWRKYHNGRRLRCCQWTSTCLKQPLYKSKCIQHNGKCFWRGLVVTTEQKKVCKYVKHADKSIQKNCCVFLNKCHGKICKKVNKKCKFEGHKTKNVKSSNCQWSVLPNKKGRKQVCCKLHKKCKGTQCVVKKTNCKTTRTITADSFTKCVWKKNGQFKQMRCCSWVKRCEKGRCVNIKSKCSFVGKKFSKTQKTVCHWALVKDGKHRTCCVHTKRCIDKKCVSKKDCKLVGKPILKVNSEKCTVVSVGVNKKQTKCCQYKRECYGKKCINRKLKCKLVGVVVSSGFKHSCHFIPTKTGKRKQCCKNVHSCQGKKCSSARKDCKFVGGEIIITKFTKCNNIKIRHNATRRKCFDYQKTCVQKKGCTNKLIKEYWSGSTTKDTRSSKCTWAKTGVDTKTQTCCKFENQCNGKVCKVVNKKCKVVKVIVIQRKKQCKWQTNKGGKQIQCCSYTERCINKKCKSIHRHCQFTGKILTEKWSHNCQWKSVGTNGKRHYCCKALKKCSGKSCKVQKKKCNYVGPIHTKTFSTKCSQVHYTKGCGKGVSKTRCCNFINNCIGKNCKKAKGLCYFGKKKETKGEKLKLKKKTPTKYTVLKKGQKPVKVTSGKSVKNIQVGPEVKKIVTPEVKKILTVGEAIKLEKK